MVRQGGGTCTIPASAPPNRASLSEGHTPARGRPRYPQSCCRRLPSLVELAVLSAAFLTETISIIHNPGRGRGRERGCSGLPAVHSTHGCSPSPPTWAPPGSARQRSGSARTSPRRRRGRSAMAPGAACEEVRVCVQWNPTAQARPPLSSPPPHLSVSGSRSRCS